MSLSESLTDSFQEVVKWIGITQRLFVLEQAGPVQDDGHPERSPRWLCRQLCEKAAQLGRCLELRHRIELLEGAGEGVRQAPHRPGREFRVLRLEIQPVDLGQQAPGRFQLAVNERRVEDQLRRVIGDLRLPPRLNLALQRLEVPLNPVHADRERINQVEALGVLGQDRREIAAEGHVGADENAQACGQTQTQRFVVRVANADREAASLHLGLEIENSKHLHAIN